MFIVMVIFIIWDVIFTAHGIWGFNERYHSGRVLLGLPLEEYLFFITVPYASVFTIYVIDHYFTGFRPGDLQLRLTTLILIAFLILTAAFNIQRAYTAVCFIISALILGWVFITNPVILKVFYVSYLIILIPFLMVNGILTGSLIEDQVVWYNDHENLGVRLGTIPFEDLFFGMSLILLNYYLTETFRSIANKRKTKTPG